MQEVSLKKGFKLFIFKQSSRNVVILACFDIFRCMLLLYFFKENKHFEKVLSTYM